VECRLCHGQCWVPVQVVANSCLSVVLFRRCQWFLVKWRRTAMRQGIRSLAVRDLNTFVDRFAQILLLRSPPSVHRYRYIQEYVAWVA
jgi:hypothetical protein